MEPFSFGISSFLLWLIDTTNYITLLICLIFIIKALTWKKLPAWWHYGLWLLLVLRMLMPWVPESRLSMFNYVPVFQDQASDISSLNESVSIFRFFIGQDSHLPTLKDQGGLLEGAVDIKHRDDPKHGFWHDLTLNQVLFLVWLSGVIGVGLFVVFKNLGFWIVVRKKSPVTDQKILDQLEACKRQMKIQTEVNLILTDKVKSPALFGYIHPRLLLPEGILERLDQDNLHYVFLHELAHLKRHDIAISWLVTVLQAIHWFNPFVWFAFYQMRIDQEIACDAYVLSQVERNQSMRYADTLVGLLECFLENRNVPALAGILESKSRIRRRIITIVQNRQYSRTLTLSAISLLLVIGFTFFTTAKRTSSDDNEQREIIDVQPITEDGASSEGITVEDSFALKGERVMQEAKDETRTEISASFSNILAINDRLTRSNEVTPEIEEQQALAKIRPITEKKLTEIEKNLKSGTDQPTQNKPQSEEQPQTVVTTLAQGVSTEELFESNEQYVLLEPEPKPDVEQDARTEDQRAKNPEDAESILEETGILTSTEKSDSSIQITNAYPAVLFRDYIDERITTTSLLHYLEGSGYSTFHSDNVERDTKETRISSSVKENPGHSGIGGESFGKERTDSFNYDEPPKILSEGSVNYPLRAKRLGLTGKVFVSFLVDTDGHATDIEAVEAEPANALVTFAGAAEKAVAEYRFKPGTRAGKPVPVRVVAPIRFEIL